MGVGGRRHRKRTSTHWFISQMATLAGHLGLGQAIARSLFWVSLSLVQVPKSMDCPLLLSQAHWQDAGW